MIHKGLNWFANWVSREALQQFMLLMLLGTLFTLAVQYGYSRKFGQSWNRLLHVSAEGHLYPLFAKEFAPREISTGPGHDGQFSYLIARDPWLSRGLTKRALSGGWNDRLGLRYRRLLYSLIAGGGGQFSPQMTLWGLILLSALGVGLAFASLAEFFRKEGISPIWALVILVNPGVLVASCILTADCLALGLTLLALLLWRSGLLWASSLIFAGAVLTKESYILVPSAVALYEATNKRWRNSCRLLCISALPIAIWVGWIEFVFKLPDGGKAWADLDYPFFGTYKLLRGEQVVLVGYTLPYLTLGFMALAAWVVIAPKRPLIRWLVLPWLLLGIVLSDWIWRPTSDAARALLFLWVPLAWNVSIAIKEWKLAKNS